ncbi:MAG: hypothetical protein ACYC1M_09115 [Armatimonadota bacterium]
MKLLKCLFILLIAFVVFVLVVIFHDLLLPVARGLPGHFYVRDSGNGDKDSIRCYDLATRTNTVLVDDTRDMENMTVWDVSHNNTRFAAAIDVSEKNSLIRWWDIRGNKLVATGDSAKPIAILGMVNGIVLSPDGQYCIVRYTVYRNEGREEITEFWDAKNHRKLDIEVDIIGLNHAPIWDASGRWFTYLNKWGHVVLYDMKLKTAKILPDIGGGIDFGGVCPISPDAKLVWVHVYGTDRAYLRNLLDHSIIHLNNDRSPSNWSPDSEGFLYHSENFFRPVILYYDIKSGRSYRLPISAISYQTQWVR